MPNSDYTSSTVYNFSNKCKIQVNNINTVGNYPQNKIQNALDCFQDNDKWTELFIPEIVDIPVQKPNMEGLVEVHSCIEIISQRVVKTPIVTGYTSSTGAQIPGDEIANGECTNLTGRKLVVEGLLKQRVIYTALVDDQSLHSANYTVPFSAFIIIEGDTPLSQKFRITPYIEDIFAYNLSERSVFKNTTIFIKASRIC